MTQFCVAGMLMVALPLSVYPQSSSTSSSCSDGSDGTNAADTAQLLNDSLKAISAPERIGRLRAIRQLGELGPAAKEAIPALSDILRNDSNWRHRQSAAHALGRMGGDALVALPALIDALGDEETIVRAFAHVAIEKLGPYTMPELIKALDCRRLEVRKGCLSLLRTFPFSDNPDAVRVVEKAASDDDEGIRRLATDILRSRGR